MSATGHSTRIKRHLHASPETVYRALTDARAVADWMVPDGMTSHVHNFDAREGGAIRISLTYESPEETGKTSAHTDTYHGRFVRLVPNEQVVETMEFETDDPEMRGEMTVAYTLSEGKDGGTDLLAVHDGLPPGVSPADNELGWTISLGKLAALVAVPVASQDWVAGYREMVADEDREAEADEWAEGTVKDIADDPSR